MEFEDRKREIKIELGRQEELLNLGNVVKLQAEIFTNNCNQIVNSLLTIIKLLGNDSTVTGLVKEINSIIDHYKNISIKGSTFYDSTAIKIIKQSTQRIQNLTEQMNNIIRKEEFIMKEQKREIEL